MNSRLFEENQPKMKSIFAKLANKEGLLPLPAFQIFCKNLNILPSLISAVNLKRHIDKVIKAASSRTCLSFAQFEGLLKDICFSSFQSSNPSDRVQLFFNHISEPLRSVYKVPIGTVSKRRQMSNDFSVKDEGNSIDLDFTIKEALETVKSKDESFRSNYSSRSREISPVPSLRYRSDSKSSDLRLNTSGSLHKRPYYNKSAPDQVANQALGVRPSSRYHNQNGKDSELDEFLKTERLIENQHSVIKSIQATDPVIKDPFHPKATITVKKLEYSKSKPEIYSKKGLDQKYAKNSGFEVASRKNIVIKLDSTSNRHHIRKLNDMLHDEANSIRKNKQEQLTSKMLKSNPNLQKSHKKIIKKIQRTRFSGKFALFLLFNAWKKEWISSKIKDNTLAEND